MKDSQTFDEESKIGYFTNWAAATHMVGTVPHTIRDTAPSQAAEKFLDCSAGGLTQ